MMKMKKLVLIILAFALVLGACGVQGAEETAEVAVLEVKATPKPEKIKLDGYNAEQIGDYFCEVVLSAEYSYGSGNQHALQKWKEPIYYTVYGEAGAEDLLLVADFAAQLNQIEGFPGMYAAENSEQENFSINLLNGKDMMISVGHIVQGEEAHGIALWDYYTDTNELYNVSIWVSTDIEQRVRNSVLLEEIVNSLGMGNDTELREDSIIYQSYSEPQELSEMDWVLLKLLYDKRMICGMTETDCRDLISEIYE